MVFPFYSCLDCGILTADPRHIGQHVMDTHAEEALNYNGCFIKVLRVSKPAVRSGETYTAFLDLSQHSGLRKDIFICPFCPYISFCAFFALAHYVNTHIKLFKVYTCNHTLCDWRCSAQEEMTSHMKSVHGDHAQRVHCSITLVEKVNIEEFREKLIVKNRNTTSQLQQQPAGKRIAMVTALQGTRRGTPPMMTTTLSLRTPLNTSR